MLFSDATSPAPRQSPLPTHESSDTISAAQPRFTVGEQAGGLGAHGHNPNPAGEISGQRPRHYWIRPLVLILIPPIVAVYYGVIWIRLLQVDAFDGAVKYRTFSGSLFYYSWFFIGVFGLSWSRFGLVGVEASMLCSHFWGASNLAALLMHSNSTWSSPSGWIKAVARREFHRLWCLLAFLSILPFIALPLSGLVFEISDGYVPSSEAPSVVGRNRATFNLRYDAIGQGWYDAAPAQAAWLVGAAPSIPGFGVVFNSESVNRSQYSVFKTVPNTLPLTESISDLFLAPQADKPVSGTSWGLRFKYECKSVQSASEFTILSQKSGSSVSSVRQKRLAVDLHTPSGDMIGLWTSNSEEINTQAYYEIGTTGPLEYSEQWNRADKYTGTHPGFDAPLIFEYAAWQFHTDGLYDDHLQPFNTALDHTTQGMGSPFFTTPDASFALNHTFFTIAGVEPGSSAPLPTTDASTLMDDLPRMINGSSNGRMLYAAPPIGVRCIAASDLGTADLDGSTSIFRNFQRTNPTFNQTTGFQGALRFGRTAATILDAAPFHQHYLSSSQPLTIPGTFEEQRRYTGFIDQDALLRSVSLAFALDAANLMYTPAATAQDTPWTDTGLTASRHGKVLSAASMVPGVVLGYVVLGLFCVWAALSVVLGLVYGFRRRPADRLDGYSMLRIGADMAPELRGDGGFMGDVPHQEREGLAAMPYGVGMSGRESHAVATRRTLVRGKEDGEWGFLYPEENVIK